MNAWNFESALNPFTMPVIRIEPPTWPPVAGWIRERIRPLQCSWRLCSRRKRKWYYLMRRGGQR